MQDVFRELYDEQRAREKTDGLTDAQRAERFGREEYIRRVREEAKIAYAGLSREARRTKVREAVLRAKARAGQP